MSRKTYINLSGKAYPVELDNDLVYARNGFDKGFLFVIKNDKGQHIGCLSTFISMTTSAVWGSQNALSVEGKSSLFQRILPHVPFPLTISDFASCYPNCIQLIVGTSDTGYLEQQKTQIVRGYGNPQELVDNLIFNGVVDEDEVQKDILTYLYDEHLENLSSYTNTGKLAKELFISEQMAFRCLQYLSDEGYIEGKSTLDSGGFAFSKITTPGVRYVKSSFQQIKAGGGVIIMGDFIGNDKISTNVQGIGNDTTVKSTVVNSFNLSLVQQKVDELKTMIEEEYSGADKAELIEQVEQINELASDEKNFPKIRGILGGILTRTSEVAQIAALGIELFKLFTGQP